MKKIPANISLFFEQYGTYIILGHREPDGDCIGSSLALSSFLRRNGKKTILVSAGPFKRPEIKMYEPLFAKEVDAATLSADTAVVVVDCSNIERTGDASKGLEGYPTVVIDHHSTNDSTNPNNFIDGTSPSTTLLVQALIEEKCGKPTKEEADELLFGLCTDTGFFRHLDSRSAETFESTARLVASGANPKQTFTLMNGGKSFGSRILISRILARMKGYYDGKLIMTYETIADTQEYGLEGRDSDTLYQLIQSITGVEAIVIVRQETEINCTVGFRSLDRIDVSIVASSFGGGGHRQASGLNIEGTIEALVPQFIAAFADQFPGINP
jgi:phosphoesterase RecJ-like protein